MPFQSEPINLGLLNTTRSAAVASQLSAYNKISETQSCLSTASPSTTIVGFANTQNNSAITSLQPLYYSTSAAACGCLVTSPSLINVTSSYSEPYTGKSIILRIIASGKSVQVLTGLKFGAIALAVVLGVVFLSYGFHRLIYAPT